MAPLPLIHCHQGLVVLQLCCLRGQASCASCYAATTGGQGSSSVWAQQVSSHLLRAAGHCRSVPGEGVRLGKHGSHPKEEGAAFLLQPALLLWGGCQGNLAGAAAGLRASMEGRQAGRGGGGGACK